MDLLLKLIPAWVPTAIILAVSCLAGLWLHQRNEARFELVMAQGLAAQERADAEAKYRKLEQEVGARQREADDEHAKTVARLRADANDARSAYERLRTRLEAVIADLRRPTDVPGAAGDREAGATLGELFGRCAEKYRSLAEELDTARAAGRQCEQYYDAVVPPGGSVANGQ